MWTLRAQRVSKIYLRSHMSALQVWSPNSMLILLTIWLHQEGCVKLLTEGVSILSIKGKKSSIPYGGMEAEMVDTPWGSSLLEEGFDLSWLAGLY